MADVVKTIAYRLQPDGGVEVASAFKAVETAGVQAGNAVAQASDKATVAGERQMAQWRRTAEAQRAAQQAQVSQETFARALGINPTGNSARDSAAVFQESIERTEREAQAVARLRAELDPLRAATDRYTMEVAELTAWHQKGLISTTELSTAQARLKANYDANTLAIQRNTAGLTRNQMASRLNLTRQGADVLVTAAMGMNPAMIAIQQGPQILDALATSGIKARAALFLLGGAFGTMAAAAAVSAYAVWDAEQQNLALERAVTGLGRTSGLTAQQLDDLARAGAEQGEVSIKSARQQAAAYVSTGRIAGEIIPELIALGRDYASVMGIDAEQATRDLAKAMAEPDKAARDLTRTMGLFDQETLDTIDSLVKAGDLLAAQKILLEGMDGALKGHADNVNEMTDAWQWLGRSIGDAITKFGEWLFITDQERVEADQRQLSNRVNNRQRRLDAIEDGSYFSLVGNRDQLAARLRADQDADWAALQQGWNNSWAEEQARRERAGEQAENQAAQLDADRNRGRSSGSSRSAEREAEREARETEQRRRRAEDRELELQMIEAQAAADQQRIQALERQQDITRRSRELIDDGVEENKAYMTALAEQARIDVARAVEQDRAFDTIQRSHAIEVARVEGNRELVDLLEEQEWLQRRTLEYSATVLDLDKARSLAIADQNELMNARAVAAERAAEAAARERAIYLADLRGDRATFDRLDTDQRIRERAEDLQRRDKKLGDAEALRRARREVTEELAAETEGAFKAGMADFIRDIRRSGLREALSAQFERAADRFLEKLFDGLMEFDWARLLGRSGGGGGGWLGTVLGFVGGFSPGVSQGFLDNLGSGAGGGAGAFNGPAALPVLSAKDVAQRTAAITGGKAAAPALTLNFAPVLNAQGAGPREVDALSRRLDQMQAELPAVIPGLVNEALSRGQVR